MELIRTVIAGNFAPSPFDFEVDRSWCPGVSPFTKSLGYFDLEDDRILRTSTLLYPWWIKALMHPELETDGYAGYHFHDLLLWLHGGQESELGVAGHVIYHSLRQNQNRFLASCLNLQDGMVIQRKGVEVFRKLFSGKLVFLWKSVIQTLDGSLMVPFLYEHAGTVLVDWRSLNCVWGSNDPALRFCA